MTRVLIIAASGATMAGLTRAVMLLKQAHLVGHANAGTPLARLIRTLRPDLIVIGDLTTAAEAIHRLAETREIAPEAKVVLLSERSDASWLGDVLRADAEAVIPGNVEPRTLSIVLAEVIADDRRRPMRAVAARGARRRTPRRRRAHAVNSPREGRAA